MKKLFLIVFVATLSFGCNDKSGSSSTSDSTKMAETKTGDLIYPYTLDKPYQEWQMGDAKHVVTVLTGLKGFENNDIAASVASFGDSTELFFDGYNEKLGKDSLTKFFTMQRAMSAGVKIKMQDWISVISKDKKSEWVTLWYKEILTDKNGKSDSVNVVDDAKIENGKIVILDEKVQHFPPAKKK